MTIRKCEICGNRLIIISLIYIDTQYYFCSLKHVIQFAVAEDNKTNLQKNILFGKKKGK